MIRIEAEVTARDKDGKFIMRSGFVQVEQDASRVRLSLILAAGEEMALVRLDEPHAEAVEQAIKVTRRMTR